MKCCKLVKTFIFCCIIWFMFTLNINISCDSYIKKRLQKVAAL